MGVYIKGMDMPKSCYACMFFAQTDYWNKEDEADILSHCKRTGEKTWESVNDYLPNCPLVPVPPHGRLIDKDALEADISESVVFSGRDGNAEIIGAKKIINRLHVAPTIIPAEIISENEIKIIDTKGKLNYDPKRRFVISAEEGE